MKRQTVITKKRRGPAPTGKGTLIGVRLQPNQLKALDKWSAGKLTRPEAIRQLVEAALTPCLKSEQAAAIDAWIQECAPTLTRPEAISRLVEIGLSIGKAQAQTPARISAKAKRLAGQALNDLADPGASTAEQADRKQDLIKGPEEFRSVRVDHRNKK
jgi:hypothetical protein